MSQADLPRDQVATDGPLAGLPRLEGWQVRLARRLDRFPLERFLRQIVGAESAIEIAQPELLARGSGLRRPGVIAELSWPRRSTRVGLAIDPPLAHAVVDHLLGFDRFAGEERLQVTPVEWGVLAFLAARALRSLAEDAGPLGPWDLLLNRVGPDPFDPAGLGRLTTIHWALRLGRVAGSLRLWLPVSLIEQAVSTASPEFDARSIEPTQSPFGDLAATWRGIAGTSTLPRGLASLRVGGVLPIDGNPLRGTAASPSGPIELTSADSTGRSGFDTEAVPLSSGARLLLKGPLRRQPSPREPIDVNPTSPPATPDSTAPVGPGDVPVTLVVELGRVNLTLRRLADLKPGDVVELGRHAREPVELTSNGRLVARGELVQIDTELGVRVTTVFL